MWSFVDIALSGVELLMISEFVVAVELFVELTLPPAPAALRPPSASSNSSSICESWITSFVVVEVSLDETDEDFSPPTVLFVFDDSDEGDELLDMETASASASSSDNCWSCIKEPSLRILPLLVGVEELVLLRFSAVWESLLAAFSFVLLWLSVTWAPSSEFVLVAFSLPDEVVVFGKKDKLNVSSWSSSMKSLDSKRSLLSVIDTECSGFFSDDNDDEVSLAEFVVDDEALSFSDVEEDVLFAESLSGDLVTGEVSVGFVDVCCEVVGVDVWSSFLIPSAVLLFSTSGSSAKLTMNVWFRDNPFLLFSLLGLTSFLLIDESMTLFVSLFSLKKASIFNIFSSTSSLLSEDPFEAFEDSKEEDIGTISPSSINSLAIAGSVVVVVLSTAPSKASSFMVNSLPSMICRSVIFFLDALSWCGASNLAWPLVGWWWLLCVGDFTVGAYWCELAACFVSWW